MKWSETFFQASFGLPQGSERSVLSAPALESTALSNSPDFKYVNTDSIMFAEGATYGKPL